MVAFYKSWTAFVWLNLAYMISYSLALPRVEPALAPRATPSDITTTPSLPAKPTTPADDGMDCQSQQIAWSIASSDALQEQLVWHTDTYSYSLFYTTEYGLADVYTTSDGFAHARGSFTITSATTSTSVTAYDPWTWYEWPSTVSYTAPQPTCTIGSEACAAMYSSFDSKFFPPTETVSYSMPSETAGDYPSAETGTSDVSYYPLPHLYPQWYEWPICPRPLPSATITEYFPVDSVTQEPFPIWLPYPESTYSCDIATSTGDCSVGGRNVQLFYWPPTPTASPQPPRTIVTKGITMTSPSVYLSFEDLTASQLTSQWQDCPVGAGMWATYGSLGSAHSGSWITMAPSSVSTLEKGSMTAMWWGENMTPAAALPILQDLSHANETQWSSITSLLWNFYGQYSIVASSVDFDHITRPDARAYYLGASRAASSVDTENWGYKMYYAYPAYGHWSMSIPPGCSNSQQYCNTIFDDLYKPQLSLPPEVLSIDPLWASCSLDSHGVYATPIALGEVPSGTATTSALSTFQASQSARPGSTVPASGPSETIVSVPTRTPIGTAT